MYGGGIFDGKSEFSTNTDEGSTDICTNDGSGVPSVFAELKSFGGNSNGVAFVAEKGQGFVSEYMEALREDWIVIAS